MAFPTVSVLDDFNRANGAAGSNWLAAFGDTLPSINSNALKGSAGGWYGAVWAPSGTPATFSAPQEAVYTATNADASSQSLGIVARGASLNTGSYTGYGVAIVGGQLRIHKYVSGSFSLLASGATITLAAGDKLGIEIVGTSSPVSVRLYYAPAGVWPGSASLTYSDSTSPITSGGQVGLSWNQTGANSNGADDFGAGTTSAGGDATVTAVPSLAAAVAPIATVTSSASGTVTGVPAAALGDAPNAAISAGATVTAVTAAATAAAPPANQIISAVINAPAVVAIAAAPIGVAGTAGGDATVVGVPAAALGDAPFGFIAADGTVIGIVADATGAAPLGALAAGSNVTATVADATAQALRPTLTPNPGGASALVALAAVFAEDSA